MAERPPIPAVPYTGRYKAPARAEKGARRPARPQAVPPAPEPSRAPVGTMSLFDVNPTLAPWSPSAIERFIATMQSPEQVALRAEHRAREKAYRKPSREESDQALIEATNAA